MLKNLLEKTKESAQSVLPISAIILVLGLTIAPMTKDILILFLSGVVLLVLGMGIFTLGTDLGMIPIGETIGSKLVKSKNTLVLALGCFLLGLLITVAEPDLQIFARQVPAIPNLTLLLGVGAGVGLFLVIAVFRVLLQVRLSYLLIVLYGIVFLVAAFTAKDFMAVAFDSAGITTGPITVPFILAIGSGVSSVVNSKNEENDNFGLCAICSIGPILVVLILGIFFDSGSTGYAFEADAVINNISDLFILYGHGLLEFGKEVCMAILPIATIFTILNFTVLKLPKARFYKICIGIVYTIVGITIFITGVNVGFMPVGTMLGRELAKLSYNWILIPISMVIGFFVVAAEPSVYVLNNQIEEITNGSIPKSMMMAGLSIGVSISLGLGMLRVMTGLSIWYFLLPGYIVALGLTFITPPLFTGIAFDSGGVVSGVMSSAFIVPFAVGACDTLGGNTMVDGFGIVAMVAMMPLITVQIIGVIYQRRKLRDNDIESSLDSEEFDYEREEDSEEIDRLELEEE